MALLPCVYCHRVPKARLYTLIWAWQSDSARTAVKTRSCAACLPGATTAFGAPLEEDGDYVQLPSGCPRCEEPLVSEELALTWLTYWDGDGEHRPTYAYCHACASEVRSTLVDVGELMVDRQPQNRRRAA